MSGHEDEYQRVNSTERGKARRFLLGTCLAFSGFGLVPWMESPLRLLTWGLVLPGLALIWAGPKDSGTPIIPDNLRRIARHAGLPELGTTVVVYTCVVAGFTSACVGFIVTIVAT